MNKSSPNPKHDEAPQSDDQQRQEQRSHGDQQNRSKKDGHPTQIGSGQDQTSARQNKGPQGRP